jgi:hypothetical protein
LFSEFVIVGNGLTREAFAAVSRVWRDGTARDEEAAKEEDLGEISFAVDEQTNNDFTNEV